jgi:hypothetical protein
MTAIDALWFALEPGAEAAAHDADLTEIIGRYKYY